MAEDLALNVRSLRHALRVDRRAAANVRLGATEVAAIAVAVAAVVMVIIAGPMGAASGPVHVGAEVIGLSGLFIGSVLLIRASRTYFLGLGGVVVCGFISLLLTGYAVLTINLASSLPRVTSALTYLAGVSRPAVALSLLGLVAAVLLVVSPWSPYREWLQPALVAAAIALVSLARAILPAGGYAVSADALNTFFGRDDPLLFLGLAAVGLAIPAQVASAVAWVYFWSSQALARLDGGRQAAAGQYGESAGKRREMLARPATQLTALTVLCAWLALGVLDRLPGVLGGRMSEWQVLRALPPIEWIIAGVAAAGAACLLYLWHGLLEPGDAASLSYVLATTVAGVVGASLGLALVCALALLVLRVEPPAVIPAVAAACGVVATATSLMWPGWVARRGRVVTTAVLGIAGAGLMAGCVALWPGARVLTAFIYVTPLRPDANLFIAFANSNMLAAFMFAGLPVLGLVLTAVYAGAARTAGQGRSWRHGSEFGYVALVIPLFGWILLGGLLLVVPAVRHPLGNALNDLYLPDPSAVVIVAAAAALAFGLVRAGARHYGHAEARLVRAVLVLAVLSFLPYAVPGILRGGGRLALAGLAIQLIFAVGAIVLVYVPASTRKRNVQWQLGLSALTMPLLAYAALSVGRSSLFLASGIIGDVGRSVGFGPFAHSRLIWTVPLAVAFAAADRPASRLEKKNQQQRAWRNFECDWIVGDIQDQPFQDALASSFGKHLNAMDATQRRTYAVQLALALLARCRFPDPGGPHAARPTLTRAQVASALETARRTISGNASRAEREAAQATALVLASGRRITARVPRLPLRHYVGLTLAYALADDAGDHTVLLEASGVEMAAAARDFFGRQQEYGEAYDQAVWRYRQAVGRLIDDLPGNFTVFDDSSYFGLSPSIMLDSPPRQRWGLKQHYPHPYAKLAAILGSLAALLLIVAIAATLFSTLLNSAGICAHFSCLTH